MNFQLYFLCHFGLNLKHICCLSLEACDSSDHPAELDTFIVFLSSSASAGERWLDDWIQTSRNLCYSICLTLTGKAIIPRPPGYTVSLCCLSRSSGLKPVKRFFHITAERWVLVPPQKLQMWLCVWLSFVQRWTAWVSTWADTFL